MKRILAFLCVLALTLSLVPATAFAATQDLQAEIDAGAEKIVLEADASNVTVTRDTTIDLNGYDLSDVTVLGGTLYLLDSQTADYTVADGVYGEVTNVTGNVKAAEGYLQVGNSFHAVNLDIYAMTLRAADVGVYYKSQFAADEIVAAEVESFGVALSVVTAPNAENLETYCGYSQFTGFEAGEGANSVGTSTLLKNIMKAANGDSKNAKNAAMSVYGRAYIKTAEGYTFGETVKRSLQEQVEAIDKVWNKLTDAQKTPVLAMLEGYTTVMENWNIPNIRGIQVPGADADIEIPIEVTAENGIVTEAVTVEQDGVSVTVPAGTKLAANATGLTVLVTEKETSEAGLTLEESEVLMPMDVHVEGLAADNTAPLTIYLGKVMAENLNMGNYAVYHVENGKANEMVLIPVDAEFTAHNQYKYSLDGELTLYMATFSEVAIRSTTTNTWNGNLNYTWYTNPEPTADADYVIRNADQLAGFGAIVGGMAKDKDGNYLITYTDSDGDVHHNDSFAGKTVKLLANIDLGDSEKENDPNKIFYPIGYYNSEGTYERTNTAITSGLRIFEGTFDGNGHTISNFYHNTWEMKGDHNWYTPEEQYYRDGMGLFGRVYKGTVKNLTVKNFSSDGEIATTGVIAAYADGATFENIAIFDCNPRVYNIGNGGIVGCVGWYAKEAELKTTFSNITVDNSNKISALWGSYDVPCGGIVGQYYPTSGQTSAGTPKNAGIKLVNCHVSAQLDVYNDVCANYQYYAYRYAGMLIGSVRENVTIDGHSYPKMDGITASGCTVHFGDWNDYYYCELVANTTASYTHDHQMSRLVQVTSVDAANMEYVPLGETESVKIPTSGRVNYVVVKAKDTNGMWIHGDGEEYATCYHFVDGAVWNHEDAGVHDNPIIDENGDGKPDLLEDKQIIYREFNNLVTGYGWGVTSRGFANLDGVTNLDITQGNEESVEKFAKAATAKDSYTTGATVTIGELFKATDAGLAEKTKINPASVTVAVSPAEKDGKAGGTYVANTTEWTKGTLTFTGTGAATITITDYYFCEPTTINVTITEKVAAEKFEVAFDHDPDTEGNQNYVTTYLYRVGNDGEVDLSSLLEAKENAELIGDIDVAISALHDTAASGEYKESTKKIQFSGTGVVSVTIKDADAYCKPTTLFLEVVNAKNATTATSATANNVVLLNNVGFSGLEVSGGYTLYGNGFTMTCDSDSVAIDRTYSFVALDNGTLDNVQIKVPNFSYSVLYDSNKKDTGNISETDASGRTRYYNIKSAVVAKGDSRIVNSYISGGRAGVYLIGGKLLIDNSTIDGGAAANIHAENAENLTLRDVTLIQEPKKATVHDTSKMVMGVSVIAMCNNSGISTPITLEGTLTQYAWACEDYKQYVPSDGKSLVSTVLKEDNYTHMITYPDGVKRESLNLGFLFMPDGTTAAKEPVINQMMIDDRGDKLEKPYGSISVNGSAYVYSYSNAKGTAESVSKKSNYVSNAQIISQPDIVFDDVNEARTFETKFVDAKGWTATLTVDLALGNYTFTFEQLLAKKYGKNLEYTVQEAETVVNKSEPIVLNETLAREFLLTIKDDQIYDQTGENCNLTAYHTYSFVIQTTRSTLPAPEWVSSTPNGTPYIVVNTKNKDWNCAVPVMDGMKVKYWSNQQGKEVELDFSEIVFDTLGKQNGTSNTITIQKDNEYTLKITTTNFKSNGVDDGMPVVVNVNGKNKLYFTLKSSSNYVTTGTSGRDIYIDYEFTAASNTETLKKLDVVFKVDYNTYKGTQYKYSSFCNGKLEEASGSICVTPDTLVTLADGTQKEIQYVTYEDEILVWNFYTGEYDQAKASAVVNHGSALNTVIALTFDDGTVIKVVNEHGVFNSDTKKYVMFNAENANDYIGQSFVTNGIQSTATLIDVTITEEIIEAWSIATSVHYNCFLNGALTITGVDVAGAENYFMPFELNEGMKFDEAAMNADIEKYGLYTYDEFADVMTYEQFVAFNIPVFKVAIGKGYLTKADFEHILWQMGFYTGIE